MSPDIVIGVLSLVVGFTTLGVVLHHNRRSQEDVTLRVIWSDPQSVDVVQHATEPAPIDLRLSITNLGGSRSPKGRVTVTLREAWRALDSPGWRYDVPNAAMAGDCEARSFKIPRIRRNEVVELPALRVQPPNPKGGGQIIGTTVVRWEAWLREKGAGSDDLSFRWNFHRKV